MPDSKLPPLPPPAIFDPGRFGAGWSDMQMRVYAQASRAQAMEECAALCDALSGNGAVNIRSCANAIRELASKEA